MKVVHDNVNIAKYVFLDHASVESTVQPALLPLLSLQLSVDRLWVNPTET